MLWMAVVGHLSSEGIREGWSFAKNVQKIATCFHSSKFAHVLRRKIGLRMEGAIFRVFFVTVIHDQNLVLRRDLRKFPSSTRITILSKSIISRQNPTQDLRHHLQEQVRI